MHVILNEYIEVDFFYMHTKIKLRESLKVLEIEVYAYLIALK